MLLSSAPSQPGGLSPHFHFFPTRDEKDLQLANLEGFGQVVVAPWRIDSTAFSMALNAVMMMTGRSGASFREPPDLHAVHVGHPQIGDHRIQTLGDKASMASRPEPAPRHISAFAQPVGQTASISTLSSRSGRAGLDMFMTRREVNDSRYLGATWRNGKCAASCSRSLAPRESKPRSLCIRLRGENGCSARSTSLGEMPELIGHG